MHLRLKNLVSCFLLLVFSFVLLGMTSKASLASDNNNIIKGLNSKIELVKIHADEDDGEEDSDDEEEDRF